MALGWSSSIAGSAVCEVKKSTSTKGGEEASLQLFTRIRIPSVVGRRKITGFL